MQWLLLNISACPSSGAAQGFHRFRLVTTHSFLIQTLSDVGTGLLLGGGISYIAPLYGWSADSIKEMDIVLVTGELVTATATNAYSDLFRALKGGANRFGIVTRYELFPVRTGTKEQKNWFGGSIVVSCLCPQFLMNLRSVSSTPPRLQSPFSTPQPDTYVKIRILKLVRQLWHTRIVHSLIHIFAQGSWQL